MPREALTRAFAAFLDPAWLKSKSAERVSGAAGLAAGLAAGVVGTGTVDIVLSPAAGEQACGASCGPNWSPMVPDLRRFLEALGRGFWQGGAVLGYIYLARCG